MHLVTFRHCKLFSSDGNRNVETTEGDVQFTSTVSRYYDVALDSIMKALNFCTVSNTHAHSHTSSTRGNTYKQPLRDGDR